MGASTVHPSQIRFSCEGCRKVKARCERLYPNDARCVRCTLLSLPCTAGQQKRVGRPRRAAPANHGALKCPRISDSTVENQQAAQVKARNHGEKPSASHETSSSKSGNHQQDWSMSFPMGPSIATLVTVRDETSLGASAWEAVDMNSLDQDSVLTWDTSNDLDDTLFLSNNDSAFGGISSTASLPPIHSTSSSPAVSINDAEEIISETPGIFRMEHITSSDAMSQLSQINLDLHIRIAAMEANRAALGFNDIIYEKGPLFIGSLTLSRFLLKTSQDFISILTRILSSRVTWGMSYATQTTDTTLPGSWTLSAQSHIDKTRYPASISLSAPFPTSEILFAPLALNITSIFTQIVTLCELNLELLSARVERLATDPITNLPGLIFGGLPLSEPCIQGMVFCEVVCHLLESIEQALGLTSTTGARTTGLLSAREKGVLWSELDGRPGILQGHGIMRPINIRKGFGRVGQVLRQFSLNQLTIRN